MDGLISARLGSPPTTTPNAGAVSVASRFHKDVCLEPCADEAAEGETSSPSMPLPLPWKRATNRSLLREGGRDNGEDSLSVHVRRPEVNVKFCDMSKAAVSLAVQIAIDAVLAVGEGNHREIARMLKEEFDRMLSPAWQCIVGQRFGSFITHAQGTFVYFMVDDLAILLFRTIPAAASKTKREEFN